MSRGFVTQAGRVTPGHFAKWATNGVIEDGGSDGSGVFAPLINGLVPVINIPGGVRGVSPENYGAAGNGVTDDSAAFLAAGRALGILGGDIILQIGKQYRISSVTLPDYVSIRGHMRQGMASSTLYNYDYSENASTIFVDSSTIATGHTAVDAPAFSTKLTFTNLPNGVVAGCPVTATGIQPGTIVTAVSATQATLSIPSISDTPATSTVTFGSTGITLGDSGYIYETAIIKTGMVTPFATAAAAQNEINSWATGGCGVNAGADSCGVLGCIILGFNVSLSLPRGHRQVLRDVFMDGYSGFSLGSSGDYITVDSCRFEPFLTIQLPIATANPLITYRPGTGFMVGQNSGDTTLINCFSLCAGVGFWVQDSFRVSLAECFADGGTTYVNGTTIAPVGFNIVGNSFQCKIKGRSSSMSYGVTVNLTLTPGGASLDNGACVIDMVSIGNLVADWQCNTGGMILQGCQSTNALGTPVVAGPSCNHLEIWYPDFSHTHASGVINAFNIDPAAVPFTMRVGGRIINYLDNFGTQFIGQSDRIGDFKVYETYSNTSGLQFPLGFQTPSLTIGTDTQAGANLTLDGEVGHSRQVLYDTASSLRWSVNADASAETGSNVGSDYRIDAYSDAGAFLFTTIHVQRVDGVSYFPNGLSVGPNAALATTSTTQFLKIPFMAGAPTGAPVNANRAIAMVYDTVNSKLWLYDNNSSTWKGVVLS